MEGGKVGLLQLEAKLARQNQEKPAGMMEDARAVGGPPLWVKRPKGSHGMPEPSGPKRPN